MSSPSWRWTLINDDLWPPSAIACSCSFSYNFACILISHIANITYVQHLHVCTKFVVSLAYLRVLLLISVLFLNFLCFPHLYASARHFPSFNISPNASAFFLNDQLFIIVLEEMPCLNRFIIKIYKRGNK